MPPSIDLNILPLFRQSGQEQVETPGLYLATPPRRTARGRDQDRIILLFSMIGTAPLPSQEVKHLLEHLARVYYKTPGTVTSALRMVADRMNQELLDRNVRNNNTGKQALGLMTSIVMRDTRLTIAHCGPEHTFLIHSQETQLFFDPQGAGRGLGQARAVPIRYFQVDIQPSDLLVLTPQPPSNWNVTSLQTTNPQGLESFRRRLLSLAGTDLAAVLIQAVGGTGKLLLMRQKPIASMAQPAQRGEKTTQAAPAAEPVDEVQASEEAEASPIEAPSETTMPVEAGMPEAAPISIETPAPEPPLPEAEPFDNPLEPEEDFAAFEEQEMSNGGHFQEMETPFEPLPAEMEPAAVSILANEPQAIDESHVIDAPVSQPGGTPQQPRRRWLGGREKKTDQKKPGQPRPKASPALGKAVRRVGEAFTTTMGVVGLGLKTLVKRILPDESLFSIPGGTMALMAIAVAVIIAATGGYVYFERGRNMQYQAALDQAIKAANQVPTHPEPLEIRTDWETVLDYLDQSEIYHRPTAETIALRRQAQGALDQMDTIERLDYQPAILGGLGSNVRVTRMVISGSDLYLLNGNTGSVIRAMQTGKGYEFDPSFQCGPVSKPTQVGPLLDIAAIPRGGEMKAVIAGMDTYGNLLFCSVNEAPAASAPRPPSTNWGSPNAFVIDSTSLFALDPPSNAVWIYPGLDFTLAPHLFFGDQVPPMQDVIDLAVNRDDLYLLHSDGHLTTCTFSDLQGAPTRCEDPTLFNDPRVGRQNGPKILDAQFNQIVYTQPPDPSIYLLDPIHQAIYHFSLRLTFQRQFRPARTTSTAEATAFTVSQDRNIFLAIGNLVYYARLP